MNSSNRALTVFYTLLPALRITSRLARSRRRAWYRISRLKAHQRKPIVLFPTAAKPDQVEPTPTLSNCHRLARNENRHALPDDRSDIPGNASISTQVENPDCFSRNRHNRNSLLNEMTPGSPRLLSSTITGNLLPDNSITHHPPAKTAAQKQQKIINKGNKDDTLVKSLSYILLVIIVYIVYMPHLRAVGSPFFPLGKNATAQPGYTDYTK